jgi:hypothetical protein
VSESGDDKNCGNNEYPFKTIQKAVSVALYKARDSKKALNISLIIKKGTYYLENSIIVDGKNINKNTSLKITAYNNDIVNINGGKAIPLSDFKKINDKLYTYNFSSINNTLKIKNDSPSETYRLYMSQTPSTLAKYPNNKFLLTGKIISNEPGHYSFICDDPYLYKLKNQKNLFVCGYLYYDWSFSSMKVDNIDLSKKVVTLGGKLPYGIKENQRFYFSNSPKLLDSEDEYYIDYDTNTVYLIPPKDANESSTVQISFLKQPMFQILNMNNLEISNLNFSNSNGDGITLKNCSNCTIKASKIYDISNNAIFIEQGNNNQVSNCSIYNIGQSGIIANGGNRNSLKTCNYKIDNNEIYNFAYIKKTYCPAINIGGVGITVSNNKIHDSTHNAIIFGGNDHTIEKNEIYNIATETDDVGAITSSRDWTYRGNKIMYNYIHDIKGSINKVGAFGIYLDDCMSSADVYENTIERVYCSMMIGGGRDNYIRNNTIIDCTKSIVFDDRGTTWMNLDQLYNNLKAVPYSSSLWTKKYPEIKTLINNPNPGIPYGNKIYNNKIVNSGKIAVSEAVRRYGSIK